jgi:DNA polymerase-3 subunit beta
LIVRVERTEFLRRFKMVEKAINENKAKIRQILACVYLEAKNNELFFCATNLELTIMTSMKCETISEGKITFHHSLIEEYIKELGDNEIILNAEGQSLMIESSDSASEFELMDPEEFPKFPKENKGDMEFDGCVKISSMALLNALEKVKFAASNSLDNLAINCIRMEIENNRMNLVATDSYRLVYLAEDVEAEKEFRLSLPLNSADALTKLLRTKEEKEVTIYFEDNQIYVTIDDIFVMSRVIDLAFPNYKMILSSGNYNKRLEISKGEFEKILKRVLIFVKNNSESKFGATFNLEEDVLTINGRGEIGKIVESTEVDYEGDEIKISLNVKFLLDFMQTLSPETMVEVNLNSSNSSIKMTDAENENYLYIVMPMALKD